MSDRTRFDDLADAAERYGGCSLDNYAVIRSVAENISTGFCRFLGAQGDVCVHLVPPQGAWTPRPYRSGAFSVSGSGFLPLGAISFGLAVKVSRTGDWTRLVLTCAKKGRHVEIAIANGPVFDLNLPLDADALQGVFEKLHAHLVAWFSDQADLYDNGDYGGRTIGFDLVHSDEGAS
ncbi:MULTISPECIES: hypothetical protein [Maricaulis]|jgi:hypothetical protein|uniref:Uncharacterized protein n=1 Tax=Maricaulis maris (strain MCS10) TaxID=394221 RepID=Q0AKP1_MARMM|nr:MULTISPECIES: hypothetical protein [Maricaulis]ABI67152.1 hypothetical protein Mmar10_2871 [Maricaulis maris MCS10]